MISYQSCRFNRILVKIATIYRIQTHTVLDNSLSYQPRWNIDDTRKTTHRCQITIRSFNTTEIAAALKPLNLAEHARFYVITTSFQISR